MTHHASLIRGVGLVTLVPALAACAALQPVRLPQQTKPGNVYFFAGIAEYGSDAVRSIVKRVAGDGFNAQYVHSSHRDELASRIVEAHNQQLLSGPVILVGFSMGGGSVVNVARALQDSGIDVDALVIIDGFAVGTIPSNVRVCHNIHKPGLFPFDAQIKLESPTTQLVDENLAQVKPKAGEGFGVTHWDLMSARGTQNVVERTIRRYLAAEPAE